MMEAINMRRNALIGLTTAVCLCTAASSAYAHHSHPYFYDECKSITIEGRVERVEFKDPHTWMFSDWTTERSIPSIGLR